MEPLRISGKQTCCLPWNHQLSAFWLSAFNSAIMSDQNLTFQLSCKIFVSFFLAVENHLFLLIWWTLKEHNWSSLWYSLIFLFFVKEDSILGEDREIWLYVFYMVAFRKDQVIMCVMHYCDLNISSTFYSNSQKTSPQKRTKVCEEVKESKLAFTAYGTC